VRRAAREWLGADLVDAAAVASFDAAYPDDRRRLGPVLRALVFVFSLLGIGAGYALMLLVSDVRSQGPGWFAFVYGLLLGISAEVLTARYRLDDAGIESAAALAGGAFLLIGVGWFGGEVLWLSRDWQVRTLLLAGVIICGLIAWRWGLLVAALLSVVLSGGWLVQFSAARLSWVLAALVIVPVGLRASESRALCPSHRRAWAAIVGLELVALYVALHLGSWDAGLLERGRPPVLVPRGWFIVTTTVLPVAITAYGVATRRRLVFDVGLLLGVASLVTLRQYVHIAPLWAILMGSGALLLGAALGLRRWLDRGRDRERGGYTAESWSAQASRWAEMAPTVALATPSDVHPEEARFVGKGGSAGGAGASGEY
jgi:MFS family permease